MDKKVKPEDLADAISSELFIYSKHLTERINVTGLNTIKELTRRTKADAPRGKRLEHYYQSIDYFTVHRGMWRSKSYTWYVKDPEYRLTHLLVWGHQTRNGGRTRPDLFLQSAVDSLLPKYEKDVEEAIKNE